MHKVVRVYNNGDRREFKFSTVEEMDEHLAYSVAARPGCAHFRDGKCVSYGYLGEQLCKDIEAELLCPVPPEYPGDIRHPDAGCWYVTNQNYNSTCFGPDHCRQPCVQGTRYCAEHQSRK